MGANVDIEPFYENPFELFICLLSLTSNETTLSVLCFHDTLMIATVAKTSLNLIMM